MLETIMFLVVPWVTFIGLLADSLMSLAVLSLVVVLIVRLAKTRRL